jgi:hypothetical protein
MSELIAPGTTATAWFDVVVAGSPKALFMKGAAGSDAPAPFGALFEIAHKTSGGNYATLATVDSNSIKDKGGLTVNGTYGVRRLAGSVIAGMDVEG